MYTTFVDDTLRSQTAKGWRRHVIRTPCFSQNGVCLLRKTGVSVDPDSILPLFRARPTALGMGTPTCFDCATASSLVWHLTGRYRCAMLA